MGRGATVDAQRQIPGRRTLGSDSKVRNPGKINAGSHSVDVVDLHGTKTDIHSNKDNGICAYDNAKVNIHLPSQHNTTRDNGQDRDQEDGGSIANINADGTFTHVEEVDVDW